MWGIRDFLSLAATMCAVADHSPLSSCDLAWTHSSNTAHIHSSSWWVGRERAGSKSWFKEPSLLKWPMGVGSRPSFFIYIYIYISGNMQNRFGIRKSWLLLVNWSEWSGSLKRAEIPITHSSVLLGSRSKHNHLWIKTSTKTCCGIIYFTSKEYFYHLPNSFVYIPHCYSQHSTFYLFN